MATTSRSFRVSDRLDEEIRREAEVRGKSWSVTATELLDEAVRMRALFYYSLYPEEVGARLEREGRWTMERLRGELPFATPQRD